MSGQKPPITTTFTFTVFYFTCVVMFVGSALGPGSVPLALWIAWLVRGLFSGRSQFGQGLLSFWKILLSVLVMAGLYSLSFTGLREQFVTIYGILSIICVFSLILLALKAAS